jgi:hypothetical protein
VLDLVHSMDVVAQLEKAGTRQIQDWAWQKQACFQLYYTYYLYNVSYNALVLSSIVYLIAAHGIQSCVYASECYFEVR